MSRGPASCPGRWLASAVAGAALLALTTHAQPGAPHIGYVYPAGGRQGTTFQVKLGGQFLDSITNACFSGEGVKASVLGHTKPLTPQQANALRDELKALQNKRLAANRQRRNGDNTNAVWTAADSRRAEEIRTRLGNFQRRPPNPAIAEIVTLEVTIAPGVEPGRRELRLRTAQGLSNPLVFCLGQLPEVRKPEPDNRPRFPNRKANNPGEGQAVAPTEMTLNLPATVNGQIFQGGVDRFRFHARQGQNLVLAVCARELLPYIADAVPGWFQATLVLRDARGAELAYSDDFRFHPDPVLFYKVQKDGDYVAEIKDAIYRGREDFVYRLSISESPFITGTFPLGGPTGQTTRVSLSGWNLPVDTVQQPGGAACGLGSIVVARDKLESNPAPFACDALPESIEQEPNDSESAAQAVSLPVILNGRIGRPGDVDVFKFEGRAGQQFVADVFARRLDSPLDSTLTLTDTAGRQVAFNDDHEDKGSGLNTHHADSYLRVSLPATGSYYVHLADAQRHGGSEFAYRLRLSEPQPDFALRVVPSSINIRAGLQTPVTVYALRKDGFTNEIALQLDDAPSGFGLSGGRIPAGADQVRITLSGPPQPDAVDISLEGSAFIAGRRVTRKAVPADDMMQAFAYHHLVPAQELKASVTGRFGGRGGGIRAASSSPVRIPAGSTVKVRLNTPPFALSDRFELELSDPPEGVSLEGIAAADFGSDLLLKAGDKARAGQKGNLIVNVLPGKAAPVKAKKQTAARRVVLGVLPAIPYEIVPANQE